MMTEIEARREIYHALIECRDRGEPFVTRETAEQLSWPLFCKLKVAGLLKVQEADED
jgi:hypothetical protein